MAKKKLVTCRQQLIERAMYLWRKYAEEYRTLVPEYHRLLEEKKRLGISPVRKVKKADLDEYPQDLELLEIRDKSTADKYVRELSDCELVRTVRDINNKYVESHVRRKLLGRICDFNQQIRLSQCEKTPWAMDPGWSRKIALNGGVKRSGTGGLVRD